MILKEDYAIDTFDLWNDELTEKTSYTCIDFRFNRIRIWFNNETKQPESIDRIPIVLKKNPKMYSIKTKDKELQEALIAAKEIYRKYKEVML